MTGRALSFGNVAEAYELGRPEWPAAAVDRPAAALGLSRSARVVDLAAGTGKLTRLLVERFADVVAVEPDDCLRAVLATAVAAADVRAGFADDLPLEEGSVEAVFVGDAFQWFASPATLEEIERVLVPRGALVLLWKEWAAPEAFEPPLPEALVSRLEAIFLRAGSRGGLRYRSDKWREAFTGSRFEPLTEERFAREVELTREQTAALWLTVSTVASLPDDERDAVARELHAALAPSYLLTEQVYLFWTRARQPR